MSLEIAIPSLAGAPAANALHIALSRSTPSRYGLRSRREEQLGDIASVWQDYEASTRHLPYPISQDLNDIAAALLAALAACIPRQPSMRPADGADELLENLSRHPELGELVEDVHFAVERLAHDTIMSRGARASLMAGGRASSMAGGRASSMAGGRASLMTGGRTGRTLARSRPLPAAGRGGVKRRPFLDDRFDDRMEDRLDDLYEVDELNDDFSADGGSSLYGDVDEGAGIAYGGYDSPDDVDDDGYSQIHQRLNGGGSGSFRGSSAGRGWKQLALPAPPLQLSSSRSSAGSSYSTRDYDLVTVAPRHSGSNGSPRAVRFQGR